MKNLDSYSASTTDGPATTDAALAALAAEAGLIDPESPLESSLPVENDIFHVETNGHADGLEMGIETRGNPDDVGGTSGNSQGGGQGVTEGTSGNQSENPGSTDNPEAGEGNGNAGGDAGNPGGDPPHPGGYGGFPDPDYEGQQNEDEEEEDEEEELPQMEEHAGDVTQNLLDIPLPFPQNPLQSDVHLPQNPVDDQVGDLENQGMETQPAQSDTHGDFSEAVPVPSSYGDATPEPATDTAKPPTTAEEATPQEEQPGMEDDVDANVLSDNQESAERNVSDNDETENENGVDISNVLGSHGGNGGNPADISNVSPKDVGNMDGLDNGNQVQNGQQLATGNGTPEEGLDTNSVQNQGETPNASNEQESLAAPERGKEPSENKRSEQPFLTTSQSEEDKSETAQVKTEQLDEMDTDSDALATLASAALGCDQAPTNGVKANSQVGTYLISININFL
jgi:host cell factor